RLAQTGDAEAQSKLNLRMAGEQFSQSRISAAGQLAKLGDDRARALLTQGAQRPGPQQLISALLLAMVGDNSGYSLFKRTAVDPKQPPQARQVSMEGLGACGRRQAAVLLAGVLDEPTVGPALRQMAAGAILQITGGDPNQIAKQGLSWAQAALGHDDWLVRQSATSVLADLDNDQAVPLLARALSDAQREVRRSAATALGQKTVRSALFALRVALDDAELDVRQAGLRAMNNLLGTLGAVGSRATDEQTRTRLHELVESGSAEEQIIASAALLRLGDETQRGRLRAGLASDNAMLRKLVVETLPGVEGQDLLKEALADAEPPVRFMAARRLGALGQKEATPVLREVLGTGGADGLIAYGL
ncbi:MAG: HEAT repeat domain-containing protein, partial [Gemmatimonadetes bacterium]|nr:HEAT repeat domain-containing protein [Gemmatimonadota bacterium]